MTTTRHVRVFIGYFEKCLPKKNKKAKNKINPKGLLKNTLINVISGTFLASISKSCANTKLLKNSDNMHSINLFTVL